MKITEVFLDTINFVKKMDRMINQTISFRLVGSDGTMLCKYNMHSDEYKVYNKDYIIQENLMEKNAVSASMKSGKLEVVCGPEHDNPGLKDYYSIACPVYVRGECQYFFAALMKNLIEESVDVFQSYVRLFESMIEKEMAKEEYLHRAEVCESILQEIPLACIVCDREGKVLFANGNAKKYAPISPNRILGSQMPDESSIKKMIDDVVKYGVARQEEELYLPGDDGRKTLRAIRSVVPLKDDSQQTIAVLDMLHDITSIKRIVNTFSGNTAKHTFEDIVHQSEKMNNLIKEATYIAWNVHPVLIEAESGTGKELLAQAIHNASKRKDGPFVVLDCSAISKDLAESELFGYVSGAFTGAVKGGKMGKVEIASGGTLFLDEIGELPLNLQVKLLRLLQEKTYSRIGSTEPQKADIRIIAATNRNLRKEIEEKNFRLDLYYRLNVFSLRIPPLRERREDIILLTNYFINRYKKDFMKENIHLSEEAKQMLLAYDWPGNVRELENVMIRAVALCDDELLPSHFNLTADKERIQEEVPITGEMESAEVNIEDCLSEEEVIPPVKITSTENMTKDHIEQLLQQYNGNISQTADALKISRNTLYKKIKKMGLYVAAQEKKPITPELIGNALKEAAGNRSEAARMLGISRKTLYTKLKEWHITD